MLECDHKHKVCETHRRTLLKGITAKVAEILFDLIIFDSILSRIPTYTQINAAVSALGLSILIESICFGLNYLNERGWNKIMWGRKIIEVES